MALPLVCCLHLIPPVLHRWNPPLNMTPSLILMKMFDCEVTFIEEFYHKHERTIPKVTFIIQSFSLGIYLLIIFVKSPH